MKKAILKNLLILLPCFLFLQCANSWPSKSIAGNGNITTESISTEDYDNIELMGSMDVHLEEGIEGNITITADENLHEFISVEVISNTLFIKLKENYNTTSKTGIHITVPYKDISKVKITGSGDINSKDVISVDKFSAAITGSGDINVMLKATEVQAEVRGSGDIKLSGSTAKLDIEIIGSGDFIGYELDSQNTNVTVSGSGDAKVVAKENLAAKVNGSGNITYKGNPQNKNIKNSGSGDIHSAD